MEQSTSENYDDNVGAPEVLRCKRSDGKQWRCNAPCMPDKTVCEKHYYQAKKRAANSAMRATMKRSKRKLSGEDDIYLESKSDDFDIPLMEMKGGDDSRPVLGKKYKGSKYVEYSPEGTPARSSPLSNSHRHVDDVEELEENWGSSVLATRSSSRNRSHHGFETNAIMGYSDGSVDSSEDEGGETCHQCQRSVSDGVIWCLKCDRRGYCRSCISEWYSDVSMADLQEACPACRGACVCKTCLRADNMTKARILEIPVLDRLRYLSHLLSSLLPVVQQIYHEQCFEVELEKRLHGPEINLSRVKLAADEQMCCNICRIPIVDYHRHCPNCMYDLCLHCCQDLREASTRESTEETQNGRDSIDASNIGKLRMNIRGNYPDWRAGGDGRVPCPPKKYGGCGHPSLKLNRIFKMNWVAKLAKNVDEMVSGCRLDTSNCQKDAGSDASVLARCSISEGRDSSSLYDPTAGNLRAADNSEFLRHWRMGEPIIVKKVWDKSLSSGWDPIVIWRGVLETDDEKMKAENRKVKVTDCLNKSEADIELDQFMKGYFGGLHQNGLPRLLKLKDWPSASASEEFLLYHKVEFIKKMPLMEYIHPRLGILNVTAKLPHYSLQSDVGPKISISYGAKEDFGDSNSVSKLHFKMRDIVYLLAHACEVNYKPEHLSNQESTAQSKAAAFSREPFMNGGTPGGLYEVEADLQEKHDACISPDSEAIVEDQEYGPIPSSGGETKNTSGECQTGGALWDVFRRQDVPKLLQYLQNHRNDFGKPGSFDDIVVNPLFDEAIYLDEQHKRELKEEFGVVPWSIQQCVGDAVFIPTGCPFQLRNLQSNVQLGLDFLSPDSLGEAIKLGEEIRCLQNGHEAKLQMLEVVKMSLYAASSAIKEVQKLVLDPKFSSEIGFEDGNLTTMVSDNLEKITKQRQIKCA